MCLNSSELLPLIQAMLRQVERHIGWLCTFISRSNLESIFLNLLLARHRKSNKCCRKSIAPNSLSIRDFWSVIIERLTWQHFWARLQKKLHLRRKYLRPITCTTWTMLFERNQRWESFQTTHISMSSRRRVVLKSWCMLAAIRRTENSSYLDKKGYIASTVRTILVILSPICLELDSSFMTTDLTRQTPKNFRKDSYPAKDLLKL